MKTGKLIAFEGIDGTGKSTLSLRLARWIGELAGEDRVVNSFEPTKGEFGMQARAVGSGEIKVNRVEELELYIRDREDHANKLVLPSLDRGIHVVLDRYYFSTVAYQSYDGNFPPEMLLSSSEQHFQTPDLTLILDIPVETALKRAKERTAAGGPSKSIYENEGFLRHCREVFLSFAGYPGVAVVSAAGTPDEVWDRVIRAVRLNCNF